MTAVRIDHPILDRVSRRWGQIAHTLPPESDAEQLGLQRLGPPGPVELWGCHVAPGLLLGEKWLSERVTVEQAMAEKRAAHATLEQPIARLQPVEIEADDQRGPPHCPMR